MSADLLSRADVMAVKLRYFADRVRKGEKLDACDAAVIDGAADMLVEQDAVISAVDHRIDTALAILGRGR